MSSRKSQKESKTIRTTSQQQRSAIWRYVAVIAIVLVAAGSAYLSVSAMSVRPSENSTAVLPAGQVQATITPFSSTRWTNDLQVLAFDESQKSWRPMRLGQVAPRQEFQFDGHLYFLNLNRDVKENPRVEVSRLAEADRGFEPDRRRSPESQDVVRFVDRDNRHWRHDVALTAGPGDRFVFQGIVYECATDSDDPAYVVCPATGFVQNHEGRIVTIQEYALATGYSLDKMDGRAPQSAPPTVSDSAAIANQSSANPMDMAAQVTERNKVHSPMNAAANSGIATGPTVPMLNRDSSGAIGQPLQSTAGAASSGPGGMPTDRLFTGQRWDSSIGLYDYGARFYDPALGRFISPDPIVPQPGNPQDLNRYSYVRNNPLKYTDPTGRECVGPVCFPSPMSWQNAAQAGQALAVVAPAVAAVAPQAALVGGSTAVVATAAYYGTCWAMQDLGPNYSVPMAYQPGAIQPTYIIPEGSTLPVGNMSMAGQAATPGGPIDPFKSFRDAGEEYQYRTSGTRYGQEPSLQIEVEGKTTTLRPDNIVDGYLHESKWIDVQSEFYSKPIGNLGTGMELHVKTWSSMVERYSLAAQQNGYLGVKVFVNSQEAVEIATRMFVDYKNVFFIFAP